MRLLWWTLLVGHGATLVISAVGPEPLVRGALAGAAIVWLVWLLREKLGAEGRS